MKSCFILLVVAIISVNGAPKRAKREAYSLPDGADILVGSVRTTFTCLGDGYYADIENNCQIFHICHSYENGDGSYEQKQWSFLCGNQTVFNQHTLTCATVEESIPCPQSGDFFYLNERIRSDDPKMYFLKEEDMQRAAPLYGNVLGAAVQPSVSRGGGSIRG